MMFSVPQFIDVEDKIAGPLTWKQILWMIGMGAVLLTFYNLFNTFAFFVLAVPTILLFSLFAFYRPSGMTMTQYALHAVYFLFRPKIAVWERPVFRPKAAPMKTASEQNPAAQPKQVSREELRKLARFLDEHRDA